MLPRHLVSIKLCSFNHITFNKLSRQAHRHSLRSSCSQPGHTTATPSLYLYHHHLHIDTTTWNENFSIAILTCYINGNTWKENGKNPWNPFTQPSPIQGMSTSNYYEDNKLVVNPLDLLHSDDRSNDVHSSALIWHLLEIRTARRSNDPTSSCKPSDHTVSVFSTKPQAVNIFYLRLSMSLIHCVVVRSNDRIGHLKKS